jgi:mannose/fructose/sorbose-specific phosphotransferase system IIA component
VIRALIVTHGQLGKELLNSVEKVIGPQTEAVVLSNEGQSLDQIISSVRAHLDSSPMIIFVDFCGGSPYVACKNLRMNHPLCAVISGVNFPMLISFFTKREKLSFAELVEVAKADGLRGIQVLSE